MIALLRSLCVGIAIAGVLVAVFAAASQAQTVMGIAGLVAAVAALLWGLLMWVFDDDSDAEPEPADAVALEPHSWAERWDNVATALPDDELPYRPVGKRPFWDTTVFGAPE